MTLAPIVARAGCLAIRLLVALQPKDFRRGFGACVVDDTSGEIHSAVPSGTIATFSVVVHAVIDTARGLLVERAIQLDAFRKAMQNAFMSDVRQAARTLSRDRGFTAVALATLAASLALCVVVAVLVNAYLMRGLPYPDSRRLFDITYAPPATAPPRGLEKLDWRSLADVIELGIAWDLDGFTLRGGAYPEMVQGTWVTQGYMSGFGVRPALGRSFQETDFESGRPNVALISHRLWGARFASDPAVIGRTFEAFVGDRPHEAETFTVVGVLPAGHWHLNTFTEVLAPLRAPTYPYMVRLREGVPANVAADRISALVRAGITGMPEGWRVELQSTHARYVQQIRPMLLSVSIATGLVLLIACANVAVLLTVRAVRRRRDMAVRQALGANAAQITRACAAEPLILVVSAVAAGLCVGWSTIAGIAPLMAHYLGRPAPGGTTALRIDGEAVLVTAAAGLLMILVCSVVPLVVARRTPISLVLSAGQRGGTEGPAQRRARSVLITIEVAACLTLLVGAGLAIQSALGMLRVDMGLDARSVLVGRFDLPQRTYRDAQSRSAFFERVLARASELDGLQGVGLTNFWPLQQSPMREVGAADSTVSFSTRAGMVGVSPEYFGLLRIPLLDGRLFTPGDRIGTEPVALISRTLASRLWPSTTAIGHQLRVAPPPNSPPTARTLTLTVVGAVGDIRHAHTDEDLADVWIPLLQFPSPGAFAYLRVAGNEPAAEQDMRTLLSSIDGAVAFGGSRPLADILDVQRAGTRLLGYVLVVFAAFAFILALIGMYGVIAYSVKQREREIAVRLAMGADRGVITRMFVGQGATVLAIGLVLGTAGAVGLGQVLRSQLFGVRPADPLVIIAMTLALALCGLGAILWPARAAASLDPASALKE